MSGTVVMHYKAHRQMAVFKNTRPLTPSTVKRRVMKKRRGRWPMQHLVAMRKNCSWAI